jgi:hypothetical protein
VRINKILIINNNNEFGWLNFDWLSFPFWLALAGATAGFAWVEVDRDEVIAISVTVTSVSAPTLETGGVVFICNTFVVPLEITVIGDGDGDGAASFVVIVGQVSVDVVLIVKVGLLFMVKVQKELAVIGSDNVLQSNCLLSFNAKPWGFFFIFFYFELIINAPCYEIFFFFFVDFRMSLP